MLFTALSIRARFELLRNSLVKLSTFCEPQVPSYKGGNTTNLLLGLLGEFRGYKTHKSTIRVPDKEPDFFPSPLSSPTLGDHPTSSHRFLQQLREWTQGSACWLTLELLLCPGSEVEDCTSNSSSSFTPRQQIPCNFGR